MALIELQTFISAPPERCFDLSLNVDLHLDSTAATGERAVDGTTSGLMCLDDAVTWEARHFGLRHRMSVRITGHHRPRWFRDEMTSGPFRRMRHDHWFDAEAGGTKLRDVFAFSTWVPLLDSLVLAPHLRRFLSVRNEFIRQVAESDDWRRYLSDPACASNRSRHPGPQK
jgi:ligand-binding SRPBCC domain-containing protein